MTTSIETYTGLYFDFLDPKPEQVNPLDIARALSHVCRFGGHTACFYSVAEHAVLVAWLVEHELAPNRPDLAYAALHHDSHEAYIGDVTTPLKRMLGDCYTQIRRRIDVVLGEALGIDPALFEHPFVKEADHKALRLEAATLKCSQGVGPHWGWPEPLDPDGYDIWGDLPERAEGNFQRWHTRLYLQGGTKVYRP